MIRIAICDDNKAFINYMTKVVKREFATHTTVKFEIESYTSSELFFYHHSIKPFDIVFLDIDMPELDGFQLASELSNSNNCYIIFVTSHDELVFDALKSFPYSFIRKNMIDIDLSECVSRINSYFKQIHQTIILHSERKDIPIIIDEIVYLEKIKNYVIYHTYNQDYKVRSDMNTEFEKISSYSFVRPHIGYAVNNKAIQYIAVDCVLLKNDITIPMNKKYREEIKKKYFKWLGDKNA